MLLKLIQAYVENEDKDAYFVVFLDMEKALDRCCGGEGLTALDHHCQGQGVGPHGHRLHSILGASL